MTEEKTQPGLGALVSDCCHAPVEMIAAGGETTTGLATCSKCGKTCGVAIPKDQEAKDV